MGHTLVTKFDQAGYAQIQKLLDRANIHKNNKIPFGRDCDRAEVNRILSYHITIFHWKKKEDEEYLKSLDAFHFLPCRVLVTGVSCLPGKEDSLALCLTVAPDENYVKMNHALESAICHPTEDNLHITLSVSKDHDLIRQQQQALETHLSPIYLNIVGLDLYHIWNPTKYIKTFSNY